jgi:hypothetical protein
MKVGMKESLNQLLAGLGEELDIPDHVYEDAVLRYGEVANWLHADDSPLQQYDPEIFPQGSFRLGTTVRPAHSAGEYDIDLVCRLKIAKESITQKELKHKVGNRLMAHNEYKKMIKESRRCWTLKYPQQFHMDVLPCIPNQERPLDLQAILLTDKELFRWQHSNPNAYAEWFYQRMAVRLIREKERLMKAESAYKSIDQVPEWRVRTPLQRGVQLLKRHRDIYFANDPEHCPVSIILTTLAARAYNNEDNIFDAIIGMVRNMPQHIENRNGQWWVTNPVEPEENFADKWNEKPRKRVAFLTWLKRVQEDFDYALNAYSIEEASRLRKALGSTDGGFFTESLGVTTVGKSVGKRSAEPYVPPLGSIQHVLQLPERENCQFKASLTGELYITHKKRFDVLSDKPVPKHVLIKFTVSTTTPKPYTVKWQVVNTGDAAAMANMMRGDFYESNASDKHVRWEPTAFLGTHWVEAFIINKDGECVARSGRKFVRIR